MIVTLLEREKMNSLLLPDKGKGRYWLRDNDNGRKIISIKRKRRRWIVELNENIRIPEGGCQNADMVYLRPSSLYTLYQKETDTVLHLLTESDDISCRKYTRYTINGNGDIYIGRSRTNAVCFQNAAVSFVHARLVRNHDTWILYDENSKNGVYVNNVRIQGRCRLRPGNLVYIMGLRIIIGKGFLAVNNPGGSVNLDRKRFSVLKREMLSGEKQKCGMGQSAEAAARHIDGKQTGEAGTGQAVVKENSILSVEECMDTIMKRTEGLWKREPIGEGFLKLNAGWDDTVVDLKKYPMMGISGKWVDVLDFAKGLLLQMITYYRYDDFKIVFLLDKETEREWRTVRWLPHVWEDGRQTQLFAYDAMKKGQILKSVIEKTKKETGKCRTHYTFFVCMKELEERQIQCFYDQDIGADVTVLFLSDECSFLPSICRAVINLEGNRGSIYDKAGKQQMDFAPVYVKQDIDLCCLQLANLEPETNGPAGHRLVELYLPAAGMSFDVRIPDHCMIGELIPMLMKALKEETQGAFCPEGAVLCEREAGIVLNMNLTPEQQGILNGTRLMLI